MKGYLGHIRRLVSILCALVVLNAGALPACADYEERTEPAEKTFETDAVPDDVEQKEESSNSGNEETPKEEINGQLDEPGKDKDSGDEPFQGKNDLLKKQSEPGIMADSENEEDDAGTFLELRGDFVSEEENHQNAYDQSEECGASEEQKKIAEITDPAKEDGIQFGQVEDERKPTDSDQNNEKTDEQEDTLLSELRDGTDEFTSKRSMLLASKVNDDIAEDTGAKTEEKGEETQPQEIALRNTKGDTGYTVAVSFPTTRTFAKSYYVLAIVDGVKYKAAIMQNTELVSFGEISELPGRPESVAIVGESDETLSEIQINSSWYIISDPILEDHKYTLTGYERKVSYIDFCKKKGTKMQGTYYIVAKRKGSGIAVAYTKIVNGEVNTNGSGGTLYNDSTFVIIKTESFDLYTYTNYPGSYPDRIESPGSIGNSDVVFSWDNEPTYGTYSIYATNRKDLEIEERSEYGSVTITNKDQDGTELSGSTFKLYVDEDCTTEIGSYTGGSFVISTGVAPLKDNLPDGTENNNTKTFYLKETAAPTGYQGDESVHPVVITATITRYLDTALNKIIIKTSYGITIDGLASVSIINQQIVPITENGNITVTNKDQDGAELSGSTFKLYSEAGCTTEINSYTGGSFTISTEETKLKEYLPDGTENNKTVTLYLKETAAPTGYQGDERTHPVVISASITRYPDTTQNKIIIKTSYGITIDGLASASIINKQIKHITENASITVTNRDQNGAELRGSTFKLYTEAGCTTKISTYTGGSFTISTGEAPLQNNLPDGTENNNTKTFYLKETAAPTGYQGDEGTHPVVITATIKRYPDEEENKIVVATSYGIKIDGAETIDIENTKLTGAERVDRIITIVNKDDSENELNGSSFGLYSNDGCTAAIATCIGGRFTIGTDETALANYLPTETGAGNARKLYLKQTAAPAGYDADIKVHTVVITKVIDTYLDNEANKFITRTTYEITIDNGSTIDITNPKRTKEECVHGNATVTTKDEAGEALSGLVFGLYPSQGCAENTEIATYSEQSFAISTGSDALKSYLPTETGTDHATTLYLKQKAAPIGYNADTTAYPVVITKAVNTELVEESNSYTFVTTITYGIAIDARNAIDITNKKRIKEECVNGSVTVTSKDEAGEALSGLSFGLYPSQECVEGTEITTYTGQSFTISTDLSALSGHLPTETGEENAAALYLKQKAAPDGYEPDTAIHPVIITMATVTALDSNDNAFTTTTTYGITIDTESEITITNKRHSDSNTGGNTIKQEGEGNPTNEVNGDITGSEGNGNNTTAGEGEDTATEESGKSTRDGEDEGIATGENDKIVSGGKVDTTAAWDMKSRGTKAKPAMLKQNTSIPQASDEQKEGEVIHRAEIEWFISMLQETISIITRLREFLSTFVRTNLFAFLK